MTPPLGAVAIDSGDLSLGGGLLALVRPALERLAPAGFSPEQAQILSDLHTPNFM